MLGQSSFSIIIYFKDICFIHPHLLRRIFFSNHSTSILSTYLLTNLPLALFLKLCMIPPKDFVFCHRLRRGSKIVKIMVLFHDQQLRLVKPIFLSAF